ncbi:YcjF family protein [Rhodobacteraceae bacterium D3-12]|nr:YcjF family protein [Rhodobacteraceae bacterium D3-12]
MTNGPVLIDLEGSDAKSPAEAPPVPDTGLPEGRAMQSVAALATARPSRLAKWFWGLLGALLLAAVSVAAWDFAWGLIDRSPILGYLIGALAIAFLFVLAVIALRELAAFSRLKRMDGLHRAAAEALLTDDLGAAKEVVARLDRLYAGREALTLGRERLKHRAPEQFDAATLLSLAETELMTPLDAAATKEVEAAARQVATVTALVPLALADVFTALTANLRMIRRVAEIYGGRSGTLGSWRLTRAVLTHLVATGAVAVGDDMIGSIAGGGLLGKLSRRFGEGVVNGALTARVGVAAIEVCRPVPFSTGKRPSVSRLVSRALAGLFGGGK